MKHKPIYDLRREADVEPVAPRMDRREKLLRWAELLEAGPRRLRSLSEVELLPQAERAATRAEGSALAVAFADPALRTAGLASDRFGDARDFFELSEREAHAILCSCLLGGEPTSERVAAEVRRVAGRETTGTRLWLGTVAVTIAVTAAGAAALLG